MEKISSNLVTCRKKCEKTTTPFWKHASETGLQSYLYLQHDGWGKFDFEVLEYNFSQKEKNCLFATIHFDGWSCVEWMKLNRHKNMSNLLELNIIWKSYDALLIRIWMRFYSKSWRGLKCLWFHRRIKYDFMLSILDFLIQSFYETKEVIYDLVWFPSNFFKFCRKS